MPAKSKSQMRLMYAVMNGDSNAVSKKVAKEYIDESTKKSYNKLPEKKRTKK